MFTIANTFMGGYKTSDNMCYTLKILAELYGAQGRSSTDAAALYRKPIIILNASIVEAAIDDLHLRLNTYTIEGIKGIGQKVLAKIRSKTYDDFAKVIDCARAHNLLDELGKSFYDELHELRKLRNRIHIQNKNRNFEPDEGDAFSSIRQEQSERLVELILKHLASRYPRPAEKQGHLCDFHIPWAERYPQ